MSLWETVVAGGVIMIFLGVLSVAALALIVKYFIVLRAESNSISVMSDEVLALATEGKYEEAVGLCSNNSYYITRILKAGLKSTGKPYIIIRESIEGFAARETILMRRDTVYLNAIAVLSPMLGLLGTVLGMMQAFNVIALQEGLGKPEMLAEGIAKALVTTAAGLIIAIPAMGFCFYFRAKIQQIAIQAQEKSAELIAIMVGRS